MAGAVLSSRIDPFYGLPTPMLFAHRGGMLEAPESTERAFRSAQDEVGVDVFELDVQMTRDGRYVVWHGPDLDNVLIDGVAPDAPQRLVGRRLITDFAWHELDGRAWVADPPAVPGRPRGDLSHVPRDADRRLLLFEEFLRLSPDVPKNIEMKPSVGIDGIPGFIRLLDANRGERPIVVTSAKESFLAAFRKVMAERPPGKRYSTNISMEQHVRILFASYLPLLDFPRLEDRSFQTTHSRLVSSARVVRKVREHGGATYVFLSEFFPFPALDDRREKLTDAAVMEILNRGVDGIMTDRPRVVRPIIERWKASR